jgi:hypothetical protein
VQSAFSPRPRGKSGAERATIVGATGRGATGDAVGARVLDGRGGGAVATTGVAAPLDGAGALACAGTTDSWRGGVAQAETAMKTASVRRRVVIVRGSS